MRHSAAVAQAVAVVMLGVALAAPGLAEDADARAILEQTAAVYAHAQDLTVTARTSIGFTMFGNTQRMGALQHAVYQRPNKLHLVSRVIGGPATVTTTVSDGRHVYTRIDKLNEYTKQRAPGTLVEIQKLREEAPDDFGSQVMMPTLLDGADLKQLVADVSIERTGTYFGTPVYVLSLTLEGGHHERMWIGRDDHLVRKIEFRPNMDKMLEEARKEAEASMKEAMGGEKPSTEEPTPTAKGEAQPEGQEGQAPKDEATQQMTQSIMEQLLESFSKMEMVWSERYTDICLDGGVSEEAFGFSLRPHEKRVAKLGDVPWPEEKEGEGAGPAAPAPEEANLTGHEAADFTLPDLDGKPVSLSQFRGKPVLLDFWASWCGPCRIELPHVQEIHQEYADKGLQVVGVSVDPSLDMAQGAVKEDKLTFTVLWEGPNGSEAAKIDAAYHVSAIPRLLLIDANGIIQADVTGYHEKEDLVKLLAKVGL
jgi:thiol-disulfide isomerase/thioredoxin/outer membrane lipoprotein-sorting protein